MNKRRRYKAKARRAQKKANRIMINSAVDKYNIHTKNYGMGPDFISNLWK